MTVKDFIIKHPNASFDMMTPGGYVYLTPEKAKDLLAGVSTKGHPGDPEYAMTVTAEELLPQRIDSRGYKNGVWSLFTVDEPDEAQGQELDRDDILNQLRRKLDENLACCQSEWRRYSKDVLIGYAEEINATRIAYNELYCGAFEYPEEKLEYLLRFDNPLEVVRDRWIKEQCPPDVFKEMNCTLFKVMTDPDAEQKYELDANYTPALDHDTGMRMT